MTEEWMSSKGNLLYHFQVILRTYDPFDKARYDPSGVKRDLGLDDEAIDYMAQVAVLSENQGNSFLQT